MKKYLLTLVILILIPSICYATTRTADSCSYDDVKAKYDLSSSGDTIIIPACNDGATWDTTLSVTIPITIQGNGSTGDSKTKILIGSGATNGAMYINVSSTSLMRVTGIYFDVTSRTYGMKVFGTMTQFRLDHCYFNAGVYPVWKYGQIYGVIDSNIFNNGSFSIALEGDTGAWERDIVAGTNIGLNTIYVENNTFQRDATTINASVNGHIESSQGGTFTVRYNDFTAPTTGLTSSDWHIMTHGNGGYYENAPGLRGMPIIEVYYNKHIAQRVWPALGNYRGGSVILHHNWSNITNRSAGEDYYFREEEYSNNGSSPFTVQRTEWPGEDQIVNTFIFENICNTVTCAVSNDAPNFIRVNKEYYLHAPCGSSDTTDSYGNECTHGKMTYTGNRRGASPTHPSDGDPYTLGDGSLSLSETGDNAYYPYTTYTCPHPLTGYTGTCDTTSATMYGTTGYNIAGASSSYTVSGGTISGGSIR